MLSFYEKAVLLLKAGSYRGSGEQQLLMRTQAVLEKDPDAKLDYNTKVLIDVCMKYHHAREARAAKARGG